MKVVTLIIFLVVEYISIYAEPGYAGEWERTRLYGHASASGDFTDEQYDWIRDHFEYFTIEKTHLRSIYGNPSHEETSKITATKLLKANSRCKPLIIYSIGGAYPKLFESEAEALVENPDFFIYNDAGDPQRLNYENPDENDWYIETTNALTDNSDLYGIFIDGFKGVFNGANSNATYMLNRMHGFRLANGMDFAPSGTTIRGWPDELDYSDGTFIDSFFRRRIMTADAGVALIDALLEVPDDHMFVCFSAYDGYSPTYEFSHAAYLIVANNYAYYRWVDKGYGLWNSTSLMTWHDAFGKRIGKPLGKAKKDGYVYTRVFEYCTVTLNVKDTTSSIVWNQDNRIDSIEISILSPAVVDGVVGVNQTIQLLSNFTPNTSTDSNVIWSSSDSSIASIDSNGNLTGHALGTVEISATTSQGRYSAMKVFTVISHDIDIPTTAVKNNSYYESNEQLKVYPNPINSNFVIELDTDKKASYKVYDINGKVVLSGKTTGQKTTIDESRLASGIYLVKVGDKTKVVYKTKE